jgi:hypothetical protein
VVWTGGDGTPHVQPVPVVVRSGTGACRAPRTNAIRMGPEPGLCPIAAVVPVPPVPARPRVPSTRPARPTPTVMPVAPCLAPAVPAPARVPRPPAVSVPKP